MYTLKQASEKLDVSIVTLRRYIKQGKLEAKRVGKEYRINEEDIAKLLTKPEKPIEPVALASHAIETNEDYEWLMQRTDDLKTVEATLRSRGEEDAADGFAKDALIFSYRLETKIHQTDAEAKWGRFLPVATFKAKDGGDILQPDPAWIDSRVVEHAKNRVTQYENPVTKAIYCDLVYEFSKGKDKAQYGAMAAEEYIKAADIEAAISDERLLTAQDYILRALEIGNELNSKTIIETIINYAIEKMKSLIAVNMPRITHELIDVILELERKKKTTKEVSSTLSVLIDDAINYYVKQTDNEHLAREFIQLKFKLLTIRSNADERKKVQRKLYESYMREADAKKDSGLAASHFLAEALDVGSGAITRKESESLRRRIEEANIQSQEEMKSISAEVHIKHEDIKRYVDSVLVDNFDDSFVRMALMPGMVPTLEHARTMTEELVKKFPLQYMFTRTTLQDGRRIGISSGGVDINDDHVLNQLAQDIQMHGLFLGFLFDELLNRGLDGSKLIAYLSQRDLFKNEAFPALSEAVSLYFDKKYYAMICTLVPQIEQLLRIFTRQLGKPTLRHLPNGEQRVIHLEEALTSLEGILTEDMYQYFSLILKDKRGLGLRDSAAHGLLEYGSNNRQQSDLLIHLLLILATIGVKEEN